MCGSAPHFHVFVRGWSSLKAGVGVGGHKALAGIPLSLPRPFRHARVDGLVFSDQVSIGSIQAMVRMTRTSSLATVATATVLRLPRANSAVSVGRPKAKEGDTVLPSTCAACQFTAQCRMRWFASWE